MSKLILTVDDSKTMRDMVAFTLKGAGFDVLEEVDGQDALCKVSGKRLAVVITDINMPLMDVITLVKELRG